MLNEKLNNYLLNNLPESEVWVKNLEEMAENDKVPIMDPLGIQFLMQIIRMQRPKKVLEIGTAIGYSALRMLEAYPQTKIITIEKDEARYQEARANINKLGKETHISVIHGDALNVLEELGKENHAFDLIFIDAAKGQYQRFFNLASKMIAEKGIIVTDNVLFRGLVAGIGSPHHRHVKLIEKIKSYNKWLIKQPDFTTSITPIGDGVAISIKN